MRGVRIALCTLILGAASAPAAQAPRITPAGDPSVRNDTIYRLAVDPASQPDESMVYLLDDGVIRYEADGRGSRTYRQVVQILKQEAVDNWAEFSFSYEPGHQRLTVNWIRVVRPNGQVVSDKPSQAQDADVPATMGDPVYSDAKVRRFSLSGVAPGTIVDYSYTVEELKPYLAGDFYRSWAVTTGRLTRRSRYILDVPAGLTPRVVERNLNFARTVTEVRGRRVYVWATAEVPKVESEPFAADSNGVFMSIEIGAPTTWQAVAAWYAKLARDRYALSPALVARLREVVAGARTLDDSLRAVHRWVAQDFRYVSISLGVGGYQPRAPQAVFDAKYGDCKDKATLFVALVRRMGLTAYPVLLNNGGRVERALPSIEQFDHAIAAVRRPGARDYVYVDLTSELTPFGSVPGSVQGQFALVVHDDGSAEELTVPEDPPSANLLETSIVGELSPAGLITARFVERAHGLRQYKLRDAFSTHFDSTERAQLIRSVAANLFTGAVGDSLEIFDGKDLRAEPRVSLVIRNGQAAKLAGSTAILTNPFGSMEGFRQVIAELESRGARRFPIEVAAVIGPIATNSELRLTLPEGWRAQLPKNVSAASVYGSYSAEYAQHGRELRITRRLVGARGVEPPDRVGVLIAWLKAVAEDDAQYIVLERGGAAQ